MKKTYILGNGGYAQEVFEQIFLRNVISNFGGFIILKGNKAFLIGDEGVAPLPILKILLLYLELVIKPGEKYL
jgi:hypothetical protein